MIPNLSNEVKERLDLATPAILFFALPVNQQIEMLPTLKNEQKYDFPDGDLLTNNALEILINAYAACLNMLVLWLMVMVDETVDQDVRNLESLIGDLLSTAQTIVEYRFEGIGNASSLNSPEWKKLRQLSEMVQQQLQIEVEVDTTFISSFMNYWLHV